MIAFGPVPSRRLGRSVGINNIPPKVCTYSCIYCQLGKTNNMQVERCTFYQPEDIIKSVKIQVQKARQKDEPIDYLTVVPDGEPTLDANLGREIDDLKTLGIKIAVITNGSLIYRDDVREDLMKTDLVSLKIDATWKTNWLRINRPHRNLELNPILKGMMEFSKSYRGDLVTETMLVQGMDDDADTLKEMALFIAGLSPGRAYLAIPTRPPAENWVNPPAPKGVNRAFQIFGEMLDQVEYLIGYEGNAFAYTGDAEDDLLNITAVHPMRESAVNDFLKNAGADWSLVDKLMAENKLVETEYEQHKFYLRNLARE